MPATTEKLRSAPSSLRMWWEGVTSRGGRGATVGVTVVAIALIGALVAGFFYLRPLDKEAYNDYLVQLNDGDLPAPPFIGWKQQETKPPEKLDELKDVSALNRSECVPGGELHAAAENMIIEGAHKWSGTELVQAAYNANIRVDISDAPIKEQYNPVRDWLERCDLVEFNQQDRTVRLTHKYMPIDMREKYGLADTGVIYAQTVSTTTPQGFQGSSSTLTALGRTDDTTLRVKLTFRGRVDDNALDTLGILWNAQVAKVLAKEKKAA